MPDLADDLRDLLRERAAAVTSDRDAGDVVRRVRRRHAANAAAAAAASVLAVAGVAGVTALAVRAEPRAVTPAAPGAPSGGPRDSTPPETPPADPSACPERAAGQLDVEVHRTDLAFSRGCYAVTATATKVLFYNPQRIPHNVAVSTLAGELLHAGPIIETDAEGEQAVFDRLPRPLAPGTYRLFCQVHPLMRARLEVR